MPFLAAAIPAVVGGAASAAAGAGISALTKGAQNQAGSTQTVNLTDPTQAASQSLGGQQQLINALGQAGAVGQEGSNIQQQQALANQLGQIASGNGPNPALAQLAQTTGQNVQQQGALAAGQRGAGANVGLIARGAADAGVNAQQQAVGQAATLRAQQQLAGISALQQQQGLQQQTASGVVGQQQSGLQNLSSQQIGATNAYNQAQLSQQQGINQTIADQGQQQAGLIGKLGTGVVNGASTAGVALAGGGSSQAAANTVPNTGNTAASYTSLPNVYGNSMQAYQSLAEGGPVYANSANQSAGLKANYKGKSRIGSVLMASGGKVPALVSPGEIYLSPEKAKKVAEGKASPSIGERIKGKAKVAGNSYANDTVKKTLTAGGVVVPRSHSGDSAKAKKFVEAIASKKKK